MSSFNFEQYQIDFSKGEILFNYSYQNYFFQEKLFFDKVAIKEEKIDKKLLDKALFSLHLAVGIGYYKAFFAPEITVKSGWLTSQEANFWNEFYLKWLGEYLFTNKLDSNQIAKFKITGEQKKKTEKKYLGEGVILPIGGGKDSLVSVYLLQKAGIKFSTFVLGEKPLIDKVIAKINVRENIKIKRELSPLLFKLNKQGALNGHIPISGIIAFLGVVTCILYHKKNFIFSNEWSANFGNIEYQGLKINHQYSKSWEFEKKCQQYISSFITPQIKVFSLLRWFTELQITKLFGYVWDEYKNIFSSCNTNFRILNPKSCSQHLWCGQCSKCFFVWAMLSTVIKPADLEKVFGQNLYNQESKIWDQLLGIGKIKPLECVGTPQETIFSFYKAIQNGYEGKVLDNFKKKNLLLEGNFTNNYNFSNIPVEFKNVLEKSKENLILGWGQEGKSTAKYFDWQGINYEVADQTIQGADNYLQNLSQYINVVKTPGIPLSKLKWYKGNITSNLNLFLANIKGITIGVTGTKGKSTTSSFIYEILKEGGKQVYLLGNIGTPALEMLNKDWLETIFVIEMSSYQCETLEKSPDISVITNLYADHVDHHGSWEKYAQAKFKIQVNSQVKFGLIFNDKNNLKDFSWPSFSKKFNLKLKGEHNQYNANLAWQLGQYFSIDEKIITKTLANFKGLEHRLQLVGKFKNIFFYNDSASVTPESTMAAILALGCNLETIIVGGLDREYDFKLLGKTIEASSIKTVILFSETGNKIRQTINKKLNFIKVVEMEEAVRVCFQNTNVNKICLLSCASPSYNHYKNFIERGKIFEREVKRQGRV